VAPAPSSPVSSDYVLAHSTAREFDYPRGDENVYCRYEGKGGVPVSSFLRKIAFGWRFSSLKIPLSGYVGRNTRVLYHRRIMDRCRTIAPFLIYDNDPYPVVAEGRLFWILDGYTTTDMYPYAERVRLYGLGTALNYIRNPVKVVIDAYDGTVTFYVIDASDPLVQCYRRIFPALFTPGDKMPASLRAHLRYPTALFMYQAMLYRLYHMEDVEVFYNKEDLWDFPREIYGEGIEQRVEAYYMITKPPGQDREAFYLFLPFCPSEKDNVISWMCANCDGKDYGKVTVYKFPKDKVVYGPMQIEARIDQDDEISKSFTLWSQKGSHVVRGNVLVIPVENSLLYVEPIYLQAERGELPEFKRVIVVCGNEIAMEPTLDAALEELFPGLGDARAMGRKAAPRPRGISRPQPPERLAAPSKDVKDRLLQEAAAQYDRAASARARGDWATYGDEIDKLGHTLRQLGEPSRPAKEGAPGKE